MLLHPLQLVQIQSARLNVAICQMLPPLVHGFRYAVASEGCTVYVTATMARTKSKTGFDQYVRARMRDHKFASAYRDARLEIDAVDSLMQQLDAARKRARLSKADLARRVSAPQESVRRLLTAKRTNPTLQTVVRLARAVGLRVRFTKDVTPARTRNTSAHAEA